MPQATILLCTCIVRELPCGRGPQCCTWATNQQAACTPVLMLPTETSRGGGAPCAQHHKAVQDTDTENQAHLVCQHKARHYCNCCLSCTQGRAARSIKSPRSSCARQPGRLCRDQSPHSHRHKVPGPAHAPVRQGLAKPHSKGRHKGTGGASRFIPHMSRRTCTIVRKSKSAGGTQAPPQAMFGRLHLGSA